MNKITKNIAAIIAFGIGTTTIGFAQITQQKIGNNPTLINPNAALEIESTNKGFLLPRLQLTAINNFAPLSAHVAGMTVYNTATAGTSPNNVTPGYYFNNGTQWVRIATGSDFSANEPWYVQNTTNQATANNQPIYQNQKVGVGNFGSGISTKQFEVKGDFKAEASAGTAIFGTEVNSPLVPIGLENVANYWVNAAGDYRVNVVHANAAAISAGTEGTNPNAGIESIIAVNTDHATVGSRFKDLSAKSEMRMDKTGNFFLEAFDTTPANNYGATLSLLNDGLRLVHSTTQGAGANWLSNNNWSEILVRKDEGVKFEFKNASGGAKGAYWFPTTTGTNGQVMTQTATGKMTWSSPSTFGTANNGLTKNATNGDFELGGNLNRPTTIATTVAGTTYPLSITGLPTGDNDDKVMVLDNGQLKTVDQSTIAIEPWNVIGSPAGTQATTNTQNIYQMGNIAIGATSAPSFTVDATTIQPKLHVAGDISTTGKVWTTNSVYADYVFEKYFKGSSDINPNYEFRSLNYVKDFIKANNHLPGVESIADLAKAENGYTFDITKLTVQSLEKIEELFLHTIEQNELIKRQQKEIEALKIEAQETIIRIKRLEELLTNN